MTELTRAELAREVARLTKLCVRQQKTIRRQRKELDGWVTQYAPPIDLVPKSRPWWRLGL